MKGMVSSLINSLTKVSGSRDKRIMCTLFCQFQVLTGLYLI